MDAQLVDKIVRQVVAALQRGEATAAATAPAQRPAASPQPQPGRPRAAEPKAEAKVFVTAEMLAQRLAGGSNGGAVQLAHNEFLTPNAADLAEQRHLTVRKAPRPLAPPPATDAPSQANSAPRATANGNPAAAASAGNPGTVGLVVERPDDKVRSTIAALGHEGIAFGDFNQADCWMLNTQALCKAICVGAAAAGVVVLPYAADAMVLANKISGIRAVQATRPASVAAAIRHFGANLLIVEHAFSTFHEMRAMIRLFVKERGAVPGANALMAAVAELERS